MVRLAFSISLRYDVGPPGADFVFNLQAAHTPQQTVVAEELHVSPPLTLRTHTDPATRARILQLSAPPGPLHLRHQATVDVVHHMADPASVPEVPVAQLPPEVLPYLYPSRYCPSDRLGRLAMRHFGHLPQGFLRVQAVQQWVQQQVSFQSNTSNSTTWALDTLTEGVGVCRDFAHLMIALCRALNIPARFTTGIDYGADPALGPTDFHAYVEAYLGHRWYLFDPSGTAMPMGFIRIGTGRDAADVSFATIFGNVTSMAPLIEIRALTCPGQPWREPVHCQEALSTG
jgi:transglutaminase-like putative cysteine protease